MSTLKTFVKELSARLKNHNTLNYGSSLAYHLILSFFPFLLFLLNLAAFTPLGQSEVLEELFLAFPADVSRLVKPILLDIIHQRSSTLLSVSLILALWSGSSGLKSLMNALNKTFEVNDKRHALVKRLLSILFTFVLALIILLVLLGPLFGEIIINLIHSLPLIPIKVDSIVLILIKYLPLPVMILGFAGFYYWGPSFTKQNRISFWDALLGSMITTMLFILFTLAFSYYVNHFGNYANTYGALGGIIILLIWLFASSTTILLGAEMIATLRCLRHHQGETCHSFDSMKPISQIEDDSANLQLDRKESQKALGTALFTSLSAFALIKVIKSLKK